MLHAVKDDTQENDAEMKLATKWHRRIRQERKRHEDYRDCALDAWDIHQNSHTQLTVYYPLLFSVCQIQHSAIYSSSPVPVVRPEENADHPAYKEAAQVICSGLEHFLDQTEFDDVMHRTVDDILVAGLGIPRVKLDAEIVKMDAKDPITGQPILDDDGEQMQEDVVAAQMVRAEHVPWSRFIWEPAECWDHVTWIGFRHRMSPGAIRKRYGDDASFHTGDGSTGNDDRDNSGRKKRGQKALVDVYEIWDKTSGQVIHIAQGGNKALEVMDDPLGLADFWPCPPPVMLNQPFDELEPTPDYNFIRSFDIELNRLYKRAKSLTEQIKAASIHDASFVEMENMADFEDGDSKAALNTIERLEGAGSLSDMIYFFPIEEKARVLELLNKQIDLRRRHVDDLLGISDVLRGSSNPQDGQETNKIKERWSGIRLRRKQTTTQHMIRNTFRIMAEVMVKHVTRENLAAMAHQPISDEVWQILQDDQILGMGIDLETDSTIAKDEFEDKRQRNELMQAIGQWTQQIAPAVSQNLIPADMGKEVLRIALSPYKDQSRDLEEVIDQLPATQQQLQQIKQLQSQSQQLNSKIQQLEYALQQFSQSEEARQNKETEAKSNLDNARAEEIRSKIPGDLMKAPSEKRKLDSEADYKDAQTIDTLRGDDGGIAPVVGAG